MATGDQYITQGTKFNHMNRSLLCRAIKRQQSSLKSVEWSAILSILDLLSISGCWSKNYPGFLKNRASGRSSAVKSSCREIIRLTVCQFVTSIEELLVLFSSITWTVSEIQKACLYKEVLSRAVVLGYYYGSQLLYKN